VLVVLILVGIDLMEDYMTRISNGVNNRYRRWKDHEE